MWDIMYNFTSTIYIYILHQVQNSIHNLVIIYILLFPVHFRYFIEYQIQQFAGHAYTNL